MSTHLLFPLRRSSSPLHSCVEQPSPLVAEHLYFSHINCVCKKVTLTVHHNVALVSLKYYNREGGNHPDDGFLELPTQALPVTVQDLLESGAVLGSILKVHNSFSEIQMCV